MAQKIVPMAQMSMPNVFVIKVHVYKYRNNIDKYELIKISYISSNDMKFLFGLQLENIRVHQEISVLHDSMFVMVLNIAGMALTNCSVSAIKVGGVNLIISRSLTEN